MSGRLGAALLSDWRLWAVLSAVSAAATALFAKIGVQGVNSGWATLIRTLVIVPSLALILWSTGQFEGAPRLSLKGFGVLALSGLGTGVSWLCYFRALQLGPASRVAPVDKLSVVLVALGAVLFLGERPSPLAWAGIVLITLGSVCVALA